MTKTFFKSHLLFIAISFLAVSCSGSAFFSPDERPQGSIKPAPKIEVFIMPKTPVDLSKKKVLMIPAFMAGNQEEIWGPSVTRLIRSILLQEGIFNTLALAENNNIDTREILNMARTRGFDYILEIVMPGILEPAGNSPGWVGFTLYLKNTRKGFSLWQIYGETQLLPRPTYHRFFYRDDFVPAPTVGQGIESITRIMARIIRGQYQKYCKMTGGVASLYGLMFTENSCLRFPVFSFRKKS